MEEGKNMKEEILEKIVNTHKNFLIEGDVSSGKTTNVLFPIVNEIIDKKESLFILDSKEEYINQYYDKLKENNYNIVILNLRDMDKSEGWNPLEYPYNLFKNGDADKAQEYLEKIGKTIFREDSAQDSFWTLTAADFFTGVSLGLFEDGNPDEINFNSINNMFNGIDKQLGLTDYITKYFKAKGVSSKPYIFASPTFLAPKDTKGSILSVARQKLRVYVSREKLSYLMNKTTFQIEDIVNRPTAIILIARDETKTLSDLASMFIEQLYMILLDFKSNHKFNFILDNFDIIDKCNDLVDILSFCLSRNIKLFIATRSLKELVDKYGKYVSTLCHLISIGNTDLKIIINNWEESYEKNFVTIEVKNTNIEYPKLHTDTVQLFDLEKFVEGKKFMENKEFIHDLDVEIPSNVDDLIKNIDEKLEQIDITEKLEEMRKQDNKPKSELEQFKIDD